MADTKKTTDGMRGFGEIFNDPRLNQASENLAGNIGYGDALTMMALGKPTQVPYGGKLSPLQAASDGLKQGIGMYNFIKTQKDKQQAMAEQLRRYKEKYEEPVGGYAPEAGQLYDAEGIPLTNKGQYGFGD